LLSAREAFFFLLFLEIGLTASLASPYRSFIYFSLSLSLFLFFFYFTTLIGFAIFTTTSSFIMASLAPEDFPQMWQRPSYEELLGILQSLELSPPVWNHRQRQADILAQQESLATQRKAEVTRYLSSVIKSPLAWIDDYDKQEVLWELASKRMSERCGRTAMGEVTRRWPFEGDGVACEPFELIIKEPALTGDSLGFKTWGSSYVLSRHLPRLAATSLFKLFDETLGQPPPTVLELGSGTGLLGVAAAALWQTHVILSDLPNIVPNLKDNTERNRSLVEARGGSMSVGPLTWGGGEDEIDQDLFGEPFQFKASLLLFTTMIFVYDCCV
jgi:hypothetical protein